MVNSWAEKVWAFFSKEEPEVELEVDVFLTAGELTVAHLGRGIEVNTGADSGLDYHTSLVVGQLYAVTQNNFWEDTEVHLRIDGKNWSANMWIPSDTKIYIF